MKQKAKNALTHDIEVLGRSVSVLLLAGLLMAAGASAALLSSFGEISGDTEVDQALVIGDQTGEADLSYENFEAEAGPNTVTVDTFTIQNNLDTEADLAYDSDMETHGDDGTSRSSTETSIEWDNRVGAINTVYANYFEEAGHDFDAVDVDEDVTVSDGNSIQEAIDELEEETVVFVESYEGAYDGFTVDQEGVTVASDGATVEGRITVDADDVTIEGFEVTEGEGSDGIMVQGHENAEIRHNHVYDISVDEGTTGIYLNNNEGAEWTLEHNTIEGNDAGIGGTEGFEGEIRYNVFRDNDEGIGVGDGQAFTTEGNRFEGNEASFRIYYDSDGVDAEDNFFYEPFNIDYNDNSGASVDASYAELSSVESGETTLGVVNYFPLHISGEYDYELTTTIDIAE